MYSFLPIFLSIICIISISVLTQISKISEYVELSLADYSKFYVFMSVKMILISLPISYILALFISLQKMCKNMELITLFSLGLKPKKLALIFGFMSVITSTILMLFVIFLIPASFELYDNFLAKKKLEANIKLKPSALGQKFLNWLVFVERQNNGIYEDITLYNTQEDSQVIKAKTARIINEDHLLSLRLEEGSLYYEKNNGSYLGHFDTLNMNSQLDNKLKPIKGFIEYWSKIFIDEHKAKEFSIYALLALFPLASFLFALSFSIINYRYEKSYIYQVIFLVCLVYFSALLLFYKYHVFLVLATFLSSFLASLLCFKHKILRRY